MEAPESAEAPPLQRKDSLSSLKGEQSRKTGGWKACPFILGNECCERLAYYGISTNLVVYMTKKLNQNNATAATNVNNWSGTCYITPLIGAFIADSYIGRYWTIAAFSSVYFLGMLLLTLSASLPSLRPACHGQTCSSATLGQLAVFYSSLYLIALGTGGIKPCVSSFGADQFDDKNPSEKKHMTSFFNWFYFSINIGALVSSSILVYIQDQVSWAWGFGIPTVAMGIAICSFFSGTRLYRHQPPGMSPLTRVFQVLVAAGRKWRVQVPEDKSLLHEDNDSETRKLAHSPNFRCLDKAAVKVSKDREAELSTSPWLLSTITQVEEVKMIARLLPIWATSIVFATIYSQMSTLFVEQGGVMNTYVGSSNFKIPPASLSIFDTLSVILWVPVYDRLLVPLVRRFTKNPQGFTQLQRMGIGLFISTFSMVIAALVEIKRLDIARSRGLMDLDAVSGDPAMQRRQMSIFWQVPQYFLIGASEVFTFIGQIEFFYNQSPDGMQSLASALSLTTNALGSYLSSLLVTIVMHISRRNGGPGWIADNLNMGHMDYFFWLLAVLSAIDILIYLPLARWYRYKSLREEEDDDSSSAGKV